MFGNKSCSAKDHFISTGKIEIPLYLSKILTEWSKAAIRTQPSDLLLWSSIYFIMKANGKQPPVKEYLDPPDLKIGPGGLTPNTLKALAKTLSNEYESYEKIEAMWNILSLKKKIFMEIMKIGNFKNDIKSNEFIGIAAAYLTNSLKGTMILLCDTFSTDHSSGILLEVFVDIYQYLARLDCTDIVLLSNESSLIELEIENYEENTVHDDSQCFNSLSSPTSSLETEFSCNSEFEATNLLDTGKSADGIMVWRDVNMDYGPESLTDILHTPVINTPMNTTVCDNQDYELLINKLKENPYDQEILSQLSDESVICDDQQSEISLDSMTDTTQIKNENLSLDELTNEEIFGNPSSLVLTESNYEKNDFNIQNVDIYNDYTEINSEDVNEMSITKYEDNMNDIESELNEENKNNINSLTDIEINKDFIVMMALVSDVNDPLSNIENAVDESVGDNESLKSEFSILDKTDLNLNVEDDEKNNIQITKQVFNENIYLTNDKESSGSEMSSGSEGFHHSDIDQQSNRSLALEKSSIHSESNNSSIYSSKDDFASVTDNNKCDDEDQLLSLHELAESAQFEFIDTPEEPFNENKEMVEECEEYLNRPEKSIDIPLPGKDVEVKIQHPEKRTRVMFGIGRTVSEKQIKYVIDWVTKCASNQNNYVQEHNLIHFRCPPLDYMSESSNKESNKYSCFKIS